MKNVVVVLLLAPASCGNFDESETCTRLVRKNYRQRYLRCGNFALSDSRCVVKTGLQTAKLREFCFLYRNTEKKISIQFNFAILGIGWHSHETPILIALSASSWTPLRPKIPPGWTWSFPFCFVSVLVESTTLNPTRVID